jgi:ATP synthase protein I
MAANFGADAFISALIGAGASLTANMFGALLAFRDYRAQEPERILMRLYGAEVVKIAVVIGVFAAALATVEGLNLPALIGAFFAVQVVSPLVAAQLDTPPSQGSGERKQK